MTEAVFVGYAGEGEVVPNADQHSREEDKRGEQQQGHLPRDDGDDEERQGDEEPALPDHV